MSGKFALVIGNTEYSDSGLAQLSAPGKDTEDFARVLRDREIGAFDDVNILLNQSSSAVNEAIDEFFDQKKPDDLLVLYFSGHGVRDELGSLYLAVRNTIHTRLRSTAIKSDYIREAMDQSRSKRQVLILDCCMSGAFSQGTKAATGVSIGTASAFESGYGRVILTASDSTQFAWEGDKVIGETDNSLFTHYLVEGLEGEADLDGDGRITVDELYDYTYEKVRFATPKQTPSKFASKQQGEIVLRESTRIENIKPQPLSAELMDEVEDTRPYVREAAVQKLEKVLKGRNIGQARSAREVLEKIAADENTTRRVAQLAAQALASQPNASQVSNLTDENEKRLAAQKMLEEQKAKKKLEAERLRTIREKEDFKRMNAEIYNRSREAAARTTQALLSKLKIPALVLVVGFIGYFLVTPDATRTPQAASTLAPTKALTPTPTLEPEPGATMTGEKGETLVYVPAGEFTMGSDVNSDEQPIHTVYLDAFWIDQTEVTNKQYQACVDAGTCEPPSSASSYTHPSYYGNPEFDNYPVVYVNWDKANRYCEAWASGDLPTEAQWEKAARGPSTGSGDKRTYPWGENISCDKANYQFDCVGDTSPVGSYDGGKSPYNAYDMASNVWEWVNDYYQSDYYAALGGSASNPQGPTGGDARVLRGGSWDSDGDDSRSAYRSGYTPDNSNFIIGFRCARSP